MLPVCVTRKRKQRGHTLDWTLWQCVPRSWLWDNVPWVSLRHRGFPGDWSPHQPEWWGAQHLPRASVHLPTCPPCREMQGWAQGRLKTGKCGSWPQGHKAKEENLSDNHNDSCSSYSASQSNPWMSVNTLGCTTYPLGKSLWPPLSASNLQKPA